MVSLNQLSNEKRRESDETVELRSWRRDASRREPRLDAQIPERLELMIYIWFTNFSYNSLVLDDNVSMLHGNTSSHAKKTASFYKYMLSTQSKMFG